MKNYREFITEMLPKEDPNFVDGASTGPDNPRPFSPSKEITIPKSKVSLKEVEDGMKRYGVKITKDDLGNDLYSKGDMSISLGRAGVGFKVKKNTDWVVKFTENGTRYIGYTLSQISALDFILSKLYKEVWE